MSVVKTSIVVQFTTADAGGHLSAEIDSRPDGYNKGNTNFVPGDSPAFLVFKSSNVTIVSVEPSAGSIVSLAGGNFLVENEMMHFAKETEASLGKPITGALTSKWLGNDLGAVTVVGDMKVRVADTGVGVLKTSYNSPFLAYRLTGLPTTLNGEASYEVLILITGEQA
jgi:hypothetical protein